MIKIGNPPYLECSSRGDTRFSAFYARPKSLNGKSIEDAYQAMKVFEDGRTNLHWTEAKGRRPINPLQCKDAYKKWWKEYISENNLLPILKAASGLSDVFGKSDSVCQAIILWELRNEL